MNVQVSGAQRPMLRVYTAAGKPLGSVAWEQQSIAAMAWTLHEELMILDKAGEVMLHLSVLCASWVQSLILLCTRYPYCANFLGK